MSLLELLVAIALVAIVLTTVTRALAVGLTFDVQSQTTRTATNERVIFEDRMTTLIQGANLHGASDYLVSPIPVKGGLVQVVPINDGLGAGSTSLVFTGTESIPPRVLGATSRDFATLNSQYGPVGSAVETALSMTPVGDAGGRTGLFLRTQCPADADLTQGGLEGLISDKLQDIRFQFYDGTQWASTWDSRSAPQKGKLPLEIQVAYLFTGDDQVHSFLVRLPLYDSTPPLVAAPATTATGSTPPPGTPGGTQ